VIRNQALPVNTGTLNNGAPTTSGQFFNASAPSTSLAPNNGGAVNSPNTFAPAATVPAAPQPAPRSGSIFSQPNSMLPVPAGPAAPASNFNSNLPVNDATLAYPQPPQQNNSAQTGWSFNGFRQWMQSQPWLTTQPNPGFTTAQSNVVYPNGVVAQPVSPTPAMATAPVGTGAIGSGVPTPTPAVGYSTVPATSALPLRGTSNAVAPATWTAPAGTPTPASPTAANLAQPATVRGNLESDLGAGSFIATGQSSPTPHVAELFGHHEQYLWLRGQLEYSATDKRWKLRYIPHDAAEGRMDNYGGSVVLIAGETLNNFSPGDFVMVQGRLGEQGADKGYAPLYHVQQVSPLE
jgi:hypothetical protein